MAAQEYYQGFAPQQSSPFQPQQPNWNNPPHQQALQVRPAVHFEQPGPPPPYTQQNQYPPPPPPQNQHQQPRPPQVQVHPPSQAPYFAPPPQAGQPGFARLEPKRSHSTPPEDYKHHHHQHHHHSHSHSRSRSRSRSRSGSNDHKSRNTFLGAGGGALIGDAIFPGLGTLGGALLGGFGGREYSKKHRSRSSQADYRRSVDYGDDRGYAR